MDTPNDRKTGPGAKETPPSRDLLLLGAVFLCAFLVRFFCLLEISRTPLFSLLMNDASAYDLWAREIAGGNWLGDGAFYQAPLYPYFLGLLYKLFTPDLFAVRLVQIAIGSLSCVLAVLAGRRFFSGSAGAVAGFLAAFYAPAVYFDLLIQKASLGFFFMALLLVLLGRAQEKPSRPLWMASGMVLGLLCLLRENALLLIVLAVLWIFFRFPLRTKKTRLAWTLLFFLGAGTALLPVAARNLVVGGHFFLTTSQFGPNFFIGNNPEANGMYMPLAEGRGMTEFEQQDAVRLAEEATGQKLSPAQVSRYWTARALDFIASHPLHWAGLMLQKSALFWNALELPDTECLYAYEKHFRILGALGARFHFGALLPLAVFGLFASFRDRRRLGILVLLGAGLFASTILFYVFARYRFPIAPILLLFAGAGTVQAGAMLRDFRFRSLAAPLASALLAALLANQSLPFENQIASTSFYNIGTALYNQGQDKVSIPYFQEAVRLHPGFAFAHYNLGLALENLGRNNEALTHYRQAARLNPQAFRHRARLNRILESRKP